MSPSTGFTRRALLTGAAGTGLAGFLPSGVFADDFRIVPAPVKAPLGSGQP
jgi:hypothetical protein